MFIYKQASPDARQSKCMPPLKSVFDLAVARQSGNVQLLHR